MKKLFVTTDKFDRHAMAELPDGFELIYDKRRGWQLWFHANDSSNGLTSALLAEEDHPNGDGRGLRIETDDYVLCDSLERN